MKFIRFLVAPPKTEIAIFAVSVFSFLPSPLIGYRTTLLHFVKGETTHNHTAVIHKPRILSRPIPCWAIVSCIGIKNSRSNERLLRELSSYVINTHYSSASIRARRAYISAMANWVRSHFDSLRVCPVQLSLKRPFSSRMPLVQAWSRFSCMASM